MTEKKQIEDLKKCLDDKCIDFELWNEPDRRFLAELVVREFGYRKQVDRYYIEPGKQPVLIETSENRKSEGEWVYAPSNECIDGTDAPLDYKCSLCGGYEVYPRKYCPNCGAKMKGGAE